MSTRHDRRTQELRGKRKQQSRRVTARKVRPGWVAPAIVVGVLALGIFGLRAAGVFEQPAPAADISSPQFDPTGQTIGTHYESEGNSHVAVGQRVTYRQTPPTSGFHWDMPHAGWGVKDTTQDDERIVHSLEHGGIVISYRGLSPDDLSKLKTLVRQLGGSQYRKVVLRPYEKLTQPGVVVTAWNWSLPLNGYDETQIIKFVRAHYGAAGEAPEPNGV